jgi:hypothetical protein
MQIRKLYFRALMRQEMAWFDSQAQGALSARIGADIPLIQAAIGDRFTSLLQVNVDDACEWPEGGRRNRMRRERQRERARPKREHER